MNKNFYLVFDFETDGKDPYTVNPVELAAVPVEPRTLEILKDEAFNVTIKPDGIDDDSYFTQERSDTIKWHARCRDTTVDNIIDKWRSGLEEKIAWNNFIQYCKQYEIRKTRNQYWTEPISVGFNSINFDLVIADRLTKKYKTKYPFSRVRKVDIHDLLFTWFENLKEPDNLKMDTLRPWFGIHSEGHAHEGIVDVFDEATIFVKFLKFQRKQAHVKKFKGAFDERKLLAST